MVDNKKFRKKRTILTVEQKQQLVNDIYKKYQKQTTVAGKYNITQAAVSKICKNYLLYGENGLKPKFKGNLTKAQQKNILKTKMRNVPMESNPKILKKVKAISKGSRKMIISQKCDIAKEYENQIPISKLLNMIGLCQSTYYRRKKKNNTNNFWRKYNPEIEKLVHEIYISSNKTYGQMRIKIDLLNRFGIDISRRQVYQYMKLLGIKGQIRTKKNKY